MKPEELAGRVFALLLASAIVGDEDGLAETIAQVADILYQSVALDSPGQAFATELYNLAERELEA